jgi:hypothetical protein
MSSAGDGAPPGHTATASTAVTQPLSGSNVFNISYIKLGQYMCVATATSIDLHVF